MSDILKNIWENLTEKEREKKVGCFSSLRYFRQFLKINPYTTKKVFICIISDLFKIIEKNIFQF